ncbi:MAG TPA: hypothetical protein VEH04_04875, partial [Verrucomicrobiae bacterium]|nr:hypothetical protein [Verrucomicrobiae bacterium]
RSFVTEWRQSQQTQEEFAAARQIRLGTLRRWIYRDQPPTARLRRVAFREVAPPSQALDLLMSPSVEIAVGTDITVRLKGKCDPDVVAGLVERFRRPC